MNNAITPIANQLGVQLEELELYGQNKAKINEKIWPRIHSNTQGKLILVTAMHPTPHGEGKTLTSIGLTQGIHQLGKKVVAALREPSLGPCMGLKGGATGSGKSSLIPEEEINLHFTGDLHAITSAHNLLSALIDNHIYFDNTLSIDPASITWPRTMDMNDRMLRKIVVGLDQDRVRTDQFVITAASEIMAILCLSENQEELKTRLGNILIGYSTAKKPIYAKDLKAVNAMYTLLKHAFSPNLVQTIEHAPVLLHGGPFANIAHGCNSLRATKLGLHLADYVITEAGYGADLGAEKFLHIKCRKAGLAPHLVVFIVTIKALQYHGQNSIALGFENVKKHIDNLRSLNLPVLIAINRFASDTEEELTQLKQLCAAYHVKAIVSDAWQHGGNGTRELAEEVIKMTSEESGPQIQFIYELHDTIEEKIKKISCHWYGAKDVQFSNKAKKQLKDFQNNYPLYPICMVKTPYSFSDDPKQLGKAEGFTIKIKKLTISHGAGFICAHTGETMVMPGLPRHPLAEKM